MCERSRGHVIDVKEGDILTVGSRDYTVKAVEVWQKSNFNTSVFSVMASLSASTKRAVLAGGKRGTPSTYLTGLKCTPLDPVTQDVVERLALESPIRMLETFMADSTGFVHVIVEDPQYV